MKNKRFVFTINDQTKSYISKYASKNFLSKAKAINSIIDSQIKKEKVETENPQYLKNDNNANLGGINIVSIFNKYSRLKLEDVLFQDNFLETISNKDVDVYIHFLSEIVTKSIVNDKILIVYAKLLKKRGFLIDAIRLLDEILDKCNIDKHLLLLSIYISLGDIKKAGDYLNKCIELFNVSIVSENLKAEFLILKAEYIWINNGVLKAYDFVEGLINKKLISNNDFLGKLFCLKAEFLRDKGNYTDAKELYDLSLKYLKDTSFD
jgi:tetratricopeptide (TPR) repeat protein